MFVRKLPGTYFFKLRLYNCNSTILGPQVPSWSWSRVHYLLLWPTDINSFMHIYEIFKNVPYLCSQYKTYNSICFCRTSILCICSSDGFTFFFFFYFSDGSATQSTKLFLNMFTSICSFYRSSMQFFKSRHFHFLKYVSSQLVKKTISYSYFWLYLHLFGKKMNK